MLQREDRFAPAEEIRSLIVPAGSGSPKVPAGSNLLLDPALAPKSGDLCVFSGAAGILIGELCDISATAWTVSHSNPQQEFLLPRADYPACAVVTGVLFP